MCLRIAWAISYCPEWSWFSLEKQHFCGFTLFSRPRPRVVRASFRAAARSLKATNRADFLVVPFSDDVLSSVRASRAQVHGRLWGVGRIPRGWWKTSRRGPKRQIKRHKLSAIGSKQTPGHPDSILQVFHGSPMLNPMASPMLSPR